MSSLCPREKPCILITGGSGLLALNWACAVRDHWRVILGTHLHAVHLAGVRSLALSLQDAHRLHAQIDELSPDLIIHAAGLTNVDCCESDPMLAYQANAEVAKNMAVVAEALHIKMVHISTDHLFSGEESFYTEESAPEPVNKYAESKLLAENLVQENCPAALIIRTNFFGWGYLGRQSFTDWIIYNLRAGCALQLFDDVYFTPILVDSLVSSIHDLVALDSSGVFNLGGSERISKYDFAIRLSACFSLPQELIHPAKMIHAKLHARRPYDMSLDSGKAYRLLDGKKISLTEYMKQLHIQEVEGRRLELFNAVSSI